MVPAAEDLSVIDLDTLKARQEQMQARLNAVKIAHLNGTTFDGGSVSYEDVAAVAKELIRINYRIQEVQFGKVRLKLSVAKLIRRGR